LSAMKGRCFGTSRSGLRVPFLAVLATLAAFVAIGTPSVSLACSMCRCGDATFNALGKDGFAAVGWRVAVDWERFDKDEGDPGEELESQVENRITALVSYGFSERITLVGRLPYSDRELSSSRAGEVPEEISTRGVSDPELFAKVRLWASPFEGGLGRRASLSLSGGVKLPWGENDLRMDGERVDEHGQPGTGSTDLFASLAGLYLIDARSAVFASAGYRRTGENSFDYRYGDVLQASLAYEHKLGTRLDGVVEADWRSAARDLEGGDPAPDTGGRLLYLAPRLLVDLGRGLVLRLGAQIPVAHDLNGRQTERTVANLGVTWVHGG
jgi:hypothetical protein